jgi:CRP/FNR family transcriptional regulator, cyclic AMP receptor protein
MTLTFDFGIMLGYIAMVFSLASFSMKRMLPLRALALVANVFFIGYGIAESLLPGLVVNCVLLPINIRHILQIRKLSREVAQATEDSPVSQWLLPHMRRRSFKAGEILFRKGDVADRLIYVARGELILEEIGKPVAAGELIGEIGLFSPDRKRTQTIVCATDGELGEITDEMIFQLYYQNPKLGFYLMRLVAARLLQDVRRQQPIVAA